MYGKLFVSIYDGTLVEDWRALITFQQMIILCDQDGILDMTPHAIQQRTGIPIEHLKAGIEILENKDPYSRTAKENGRRIIRISPERPWGWEIVNHKHYKELRTAEDRREYMREYMREKREKEKLTKPNKSLQKLHVNSLAHTDTDTDTDIKKNTMSSKRDSALVLLKFLNDTTGRQYRETRGNIKFIVDRLKDYSEQELRTMVARKSREWKNDPDMNKYLRPATLFNATKCDQYIGECV